MTTEGGDMSLSPEGEDGYLSAFRVDNSGNIGSSLERAAMYLSTRLSDSRLCPSHCRARTKLHCKLSSPERISQLPSSFVLSSAMRYSPLMPCLTTGLIKNCVMEIEIE